MITLEQINKLERFPGLVPFFNLSEMSDLWAPGERFISLRQLNAGTLEIEVDAKDGSVDYSMNNEGLPIAELREFAEWVEKFSTMVAKL